MSIFTDSGVPLFESIRRASHLHAQRSARSQPDRQRRARQRHADHRPLLEHADPVRRHRRPRAIARHDRPAISGAARSDRRQSDHRVPGGRPIDDRDRAAHASRPVHDLGRHGRAVLRQLDGPRQRHHRQRQRRSDPGRQRFPAARRRHLRHEQSQLHLQHRRAGRIHRTPSAACVRLAGPDELLRQRRPGDDGLDLELRQHIRQLAAEPATSKPPEARLIRAPC